MATSSIDYLTGTGISPSPLPSPAIATSASPAVSPSPAASAPAPSSGGVWNGHLKPAEIQIIIIVLIAGLFNAFFLVLSLRLLWRRYQPPPPAPAPDIATTSSVKLNSDVVAQLVYGLKQVLAHEEAPKPL
ncbi:MAG: hypothetical protein FRX49_12776 [Trebouxia sp. A1-2]|nr:MAG: hypothetical protein FRX49_12776 [Trebouxia sp. A1-2]